MQTDRLNRRLRHARPQPIDKGIQIGERDLVMFETLHRHGPLPSTYLYAFTKQLARNETFHRHRLTKLFNGTAAGSYLTRPPQQFACFAARYQPVIYDLGLLARRRLAERGRLSPYVPNRSDPFLHRFMGSCVSASIELAARDRKLRCLSKDDILTHPSCPAHVPEGSDRLSIPLSEPSTVKSLLPDDLFGIEYPSTKPSYRFFAVEIDRNTESIERRNTGQSTFGAKLRAYIDAMRNQTYRSRWGIPNLMVLTVTTNATHLENMCRYLRGLGEPQLAERFLFLAKPEFGSDWRVPPVMHDLLTGSWARADGSRFGIGEV
jgi:hypothetical protein